MARIPFSALPCRKKNLMTARLKVVEIACVPDMLPSLFPSWLGYTFISALVVCSSEVTILYSLKGTTFQLEILSSSKR